MCGICGVFALDDVLDPGIQAALPRMTSSLRHRGPDGQDQFVDGTAALGHRRLAIIDRAGGSQPMANEDGSCWIVFNGEIYNYRALERELTGRGHVFRTASDTETILHAYEEYGPACVERLEGMFAFAIYDRPRRELFLARDRLGKKPLFYAVLANTLHFASEIKAFYPSPVWDGSIELSQLEGYLSLGYFPSPYTVYRQVRKLEPGHWLRVSNGTFEVRKYWDVSEFDTDRREESDLLEELEALISTAVRARLESEVPLGAFLSGGIDSGLVVSFMAEARPAPVVTTSVGFADAAHNELDLAALTAGRYATRHFAHVIDLGELELDNLFERVVDMFDEPFADTSAIPTYHVSAAAREHLTVALSGDGGDEVFGGYDFRYVPHALEGEVRRVIPWRPARRALGRLGRRWPRRSSLPRVLRLGSTLENIGREPAAAYYVDLCFLKPADARRLAGLGASRDPHESPVYDLVTAPYRRCRSPHPLQRAQYADLKVYLANDVLVKVDRMSMAHGLEVRCPLLDPRIVEFAFRIPPSRKMPLLRAKHLLRRLAASRLPAALITAPKHGFTAPIGAWLAGSAGDRFADEVLSPASPVAALLDTRYLSGLLKDHRGAAADHSYALWAAWVLARWCERRRAPSERAPVAVGI